MIYVSEIKGFYICSLGSQKHYKCVPQAMQCDFRQIILMCLVVGRNIFFKKNMFLLSFSCYNKKSIPVKFTKTALV